LRLSSIGWVIAALASAYACLLSTAHATPIDRALPFIAAVITLVAAFSHASIGVAVPLLIVGEFAVVDERMRLLWFGLVVAVSFASSLIGGEMTRWRAGATTVGAILVLRWIPLSDVLLVREVVLIAMCLGIAAACRWTPLGVVIAVLTALFTPAIPLRTFALPLCVLLLSGAARVSRAVGGRHARRYTQAVPALLLAIPLFFFAWSGAFARCLPVVLKGPIHHGERLHIRHALRPGESLLMDVPGNARQLILSGANMSGLKKKTIVGQIEPGHIPIRIGHFADWGAFRRDQFNASRNPLPRVPAGIIRDYGYSSWIDGGGKVRAFGTHMRVTVEKELPPDARLQIEGFEVGPR
jgi:hypothetical protein